MIEVFLQKEAEYKAAAENAARVEDWKTVHKMAEKLVRVYGAILASNLVAPESCSRWEDLREKWQEIADQSTQKIGTPRNPTLRPTKNILREGSSQEHQNPTPAAKPVKQDLRLDDVKGLTQAKQVVMDALVNPVLHPDVYKTLNIKSGKGLLLYGPPGTGKTMFARAIAGELNMPFIYKKISELKDKYVGESEKSITKLFEEAYAAKKAIVFLDECEGLLRKRGNQKVNIVEAFLAELDGFSTNRDAQIFVLLATNRPWLIDSAIMRSGRIGAAVYVGLPDAETRRCILEAALSKIPLASDVDLEKIVNLTEGYSGAELNHKDGGGVCNIAETKAGRRWIARRAQLEKNSPEWSRVELVTQQDFEEAIREIIPVSVKDPDIVKKNLAYSQNGEASPDSSSEDD